MSTFVHEGYAPVFADSLAELGPDMLSYAKHELIIAATKHAANDPHLALSPDNDEALKRLDCVGVRASEVPHTCGPALYGQIKPVFSIADQVIDAYAANTEMLEQIEECIENKNKLTLVYDHKGLVTGVLGSACLQFVLLDKRIIRPGDVDFRVILGTTTKFLDFFGTPVAKALIDSGAFQFIDFIVPQTLSTHETLALQSLQDKFNLASLLWRARRNAKDPDNRIIDVVCASGSTDKLIAIGGNDTHLMAPAGNSTGLLKRSACLPMGLDTEKDGTAAIFTGEVTKPKTVADVDAMMINISIGMTAVSRTPSIYIRDAEQYARIVDSKSLKAAA